MFSIPDAFEVPKELQIQLRSLFKAVEASPEFQTFRQKKWTVDLAEVDSNAFVRETYIEPGLVRGRDWIPSLEKAIEEIAEIAVFGITVRDRTELEHLPPHVFGWHYLFFVDTKAHYCIFVTRGPILT